MDLKNIIAPHHKKIRLKKYNPSYTAKINNEEAERKFSSAIKKLFDLQSLLYADNRFSVLIILQAMDAAGKDSIIKYLATGLNPLGCQVYNFKAPSQEELDHDYLWRCVKELPRRGNFGIFNRSYYEEVLVVKVHPEFLLQQRLPESSLSNQFWQTRYEDINNFEKYLSNNGTVVLKFFLNVSKEEQKRRFLERIDNPAKNWKFSPGDIKERGLWGKYMNAYEDMLNATSTKVAPWHVIPADNKWFTRLAVAQIIVDRLQNLKLKYPSLSPETKKALLETKKKLLQGN